MQHSWCNISFIILQSFYRPKHSILANFGHSWRILFAYYDAHANHIRYMLYLTLKSTILVKFISIFFWSIFLKTCRILIGNYLYSADWINSVFNNTSAVNTIHLFSYCRHLCYKRTCSRRSVLQQFYIYLLKEQLLTALKKFVFRHCLKKMMNTKRVKLW